MKKINILVMMFGYLILGCSPLNTEEAETSENEQPVPVQYLTEMSGHDDAQFQIDNGLLYKGVGNSNPNIDDYYAAFSVEYRTDYKVNRVFVDHGSIVPKPTDFSFVLENSESLEVYNYNYSGNLLQSITRESGEIDQEFFYNSDGKVIKNIFHYYQETYENPHSTQVYEYTYDDNGILKSYIHTNTRTGETTYGNILTDQKVNPFYTFWKKNNFVMPTDFAYLMDFNLSFYPHNILEIYKAEDLDYRVHIEYEGDYPVIYDVDDLPNFERKPTRFIYKESN